MEPFRRVVSGEKMRVTARAWNSMLAAAEAIERPYALGQDSSELRREPAGVVLAKNTTADPIDRFRVVGFSGPSIDGDKPQFLDRMAVDAREPTADDLAIFGVTQEVIPPDTFGRVLVAGVTYLRVSVQDNAHRFAVVEAASLVATTAETGPIQLVALPSGGTPPEERWAIARLMTEPPAEVVEVKIGKPDAGIAKGASGTVSVWDGEPGSESDTGDNVTAVAKALAVTSGKFVVLTRLAGKTGYYVDCWED